MLACTELCGSEGRTVATLGTVGAAEMSGRAVRIAGDTGTGVVAKRVAAGGG
jgi:hypothetical protein